MTPCEAAFRSCQERPSLDDAWQVVISFGSASSEYGIATPQNADFLQVQTSSWARMTSKRVRAHACLPSSRLSGASVHNRLGLSREGNTAVSRSSSVA